MCHLYSNIVMREQQQGLLYEILNFDNVSGSPVNNVKISNAETGNAPTISTEGGDTNVGLTISAKNNGPITLEGTVVYGSSVLTAGSDSALDSNSNSQV